MHCCLLVSKQDSDLIQNEEFSNLSIGLLGIIKALSRSRVILKISIGRIHYRGEILNSKYKSLPFSNKFLRKINLFALKISEYFDLVDAYINKYSLKNDHLTNKEIINFQKKLFAFNNFIQKKDGHYSYTSVEPSIEHNLPNFDFFLRGSGLKIERGQILNSYSKLGCLSLHHGDNSINRGGPVGFWEVYNGQSSGITAQILSKELDGGKVLYRSRLKTVFNPLANKINIYKNTCPTLLVVFNKLKNLGERPSIYNNINDIMELYTGVIFKLPIWYKSLTLSATHLMSTCIFQPIRIYLWFSSLWSNPYERWGLGISSEPGRRFENWSKVNTDTDLNSKHDWFADPFFANIDDRNYLIFEKFIWNKRKGVIAYLNIENIKNNIQDLSIENKILLENNFHLSYPFTFKKQNKTYMLTENSSNGLWLYELISSKFGSDFKLEAQSIKKLLTGRCIDPTLFHYEGTDYLFITEMDETKETLFLYVSDDVTKSPLNPHPCSPILVDHSLGRSAGRIFINKDGKIIRPSQKCDRYYGEGIIFSEIKLDKFRFEILSEVSRIIPEKYSKFRCLHHFDFVDGMYALDYVEKSNTHLKPLFKEIKN